MQSKVLFLLNANFLIKIFSFTTIFFSYTKIHLPDYQERIFNTIVYNLTLNYLRTHKK